METQFHHGRQKHECQQKFWGGLVVLRQNGHHYYEQHSFILVKKHPFCSTTSTKITFTKSFVLTMLDVSINDAS